MINYYPSFNLLQLYIFNFFFLMFLHFISEHRYSDFKLYRKRRRGSLAQKAFEHWVMNDGTDGSYNEDGNGGGQLPNQGHGRTAECWGAAA